MFTQLIYSLAQNHKKKQKDTIDGKEKKFPLQKMIHLWQDA